MYLNRQYLLNNMWWGENSRERNRLVYIDEVMIGASALHSIVHPDMSRVWGIDISHWNGLTDLATAKANGCSFVIIKAADGSVRTRWFQENKQRAKEAGLPWGIYVWLYPDNKVPIKDQVDLWWDLVKDDYPPVGVHIDFEWTNYGGSPANPNGTDLKKSADLFEFKGGRVPEIYTAKGYADEYLTGFPNPERYKWWIANYGVSTPNMPRWLVQNNVAWKKWQFTASMDGAIAPSQNKELDGNYYDGDHYAFAAEYLGGELPPPTNGGTVAKYYRLNTVAANIRTGPGASYPDRGDLVRGDVVRVDEPTPGGWSPYKTAQHEDGSWVALSNGTLLDGTGDVKYWSTNAYFVEVQDLPNPIEDPEPEPEPSGHVVEVYIDGVLEFRKELP